MLPHCESVAQLHPGTSQRWEAKTDIFAASSYLIQYERSFLYMNSHTGESSYHLLSLFTSHSHSVKWVSGSRTAKGYEKPYFGDQRVWKSYLLPEDMCVCLCTHEKV